MKKETSKAQEQKTEYLPDVMRKYDAYFSISLNEGFAHVKFEGGKMYVEWLNDEGMMEEEGTRTELEDIERVANFMREMKDLRLQDYSKKT
jgi:hypothetical protein